MLASPLETMPGIRKVRHAYGHGVAVAIFKHCGLAASADLDSLPRLLPFPFFPSSVLLLSLVLRLPSFAFVSLSALHFRRMSLLSSLPSPVLWSHQLVQAVVSLVITNSYHKNHNQYQTRKVNSPLRFAGPAVRDPPSPLRHPSLLNIPATLHGKNVEHTMGVFKYQEYRHCLTAQIVLPTEKHTGNSKQTNPRGHTNPR